MIAKLQPLMTSVLGSLILLSASKSMALENDLPDLGASALSTLSIEKEQKLGAIIYEQLRGQTSVLQDPLTLEYINDLGNKLVSNAQSVRFPFTFFAVNNNQINAFAFYGGYIGIHSGLIAKANTESQLASVLAHEIAHVTQRHIARSKEATNSRSPLTLAGIVGSILLAAVNPQMMMATMMATTAGTQQAIINFTRSNEQEADSIGMNILADSGYDPYAASEFFSVLLEQNRYRTSITPFLLTHPMSDSRVTDARLRAQQYEKQFYTDSLEFTLVKARIKGRFLADSQAYVSDKNFEQLANQINKAQGNKKFGLQYELLLRLVDNKKYSEAVELWGELNEIAPNNLFLLDTYTDLMIGMEKPEMAISLLEQAYKLKPNNSVVTLNYANALLAANMNKKAIQLLEYFLLVKPNDLLATQILAEAYKADNNMYRHFVARGEMFALFARYNEAIKEMDRALALLGKTDNAEINRIQALKYQYRSRQQYIKDIKGNF